MIVGNHKPALRNVDEAARRRFNIVPFSCKPARDRDRSLEEKLRPEWPGILRWMIEGCLDWQATACVRPASVAGRDADYFEEQDHFGRWLAERCIVDPQLNSKPAHLLADFQGWCARNGEPKPDARRLRPLLERTEGLRYTTRRGTQLVHGIGLRPPEANGQDQAQGWRVVESDPVIAIHARAWGQNRRSSTTLHPRARSRRVIPSAARPPRTQAPPAPPPRGLRPARPGSVAAAQPHGRDLARDALQARDLGESSLHSPPDQSGHADPIRRPA